MWPRRTSEEKDNEKEDVEYLLEKRQSGSELENIWKSPFSVHWEQMAAELLIVYLLTPPPLVSLTWLHIGSDHYIERRDDYLTYKCNPLPTLNQEAEPRRLPMKPSRCASERLTLQSATTMRSKWMMLLDMNKCYLIVIASSPTIFKPNVSGIILPPGRRGQPCAYLSSSFSPVFRLHFLFKSSSGGICWASFLPAQWNTTLNCREERKPAAH